MTARLIIGDTRDVTASLPDGSVDLIFTSPPFLALRSYLPADHPLKAKEIGSEATPATFLATLLALTREWERVLAPHGTLVVELGDTYSGSTADGGDNRTNARYPNGRSGVSGSRPTSQGWPLAKSLCGIPTLYAWSLAYGRNLLAPDDTLDPWRIRNVIVWHRPNPPVGALCDKFRPSTSYLTVATKSAKRWFDLDAVRTPLADSPGNRYVRKVSTGDIEGRSRATDGIDRETNKITADYDPSASAGAPPLDCWFDAYGGDDVWTITTGAFAGAHYATFPKRLAQRVIEAMCPLEVCRTCGEPRRRITGDVEYVRPDGVVIDELDAWPWGGNKNGRRGERKSNDGGITRQATTLGWTDCGHDNYRTGIVYDPFAGSGTTLAVATGAGRHAIGAELDERNAALAVERCGMFLTVEHLEAHDAPR